MSTEHSNHTLARRTARDSSFLLFWLLSLLLFREPLSTLVNLAWHDDRYTHIIVVPFISAGLIYLERRRIFAQSSVGLRVGIPLLTVTLGLYFAVEHLSLSLEQSERLALVAASILLVWTSGFVFLYGINSLKAANFPLAFLLLAIPMPPVLVEKAVVALQHGSANTTYMLFKLTGMPVFRQGLTFSLPGIDIQVAEECSGIRSSIAVLIMALVASHLFLRSNWRKACFIVCTIPVVILKNAIRIATISWLGVYVSRDFFYGNLHRRGGLPFSMISLIVLIPLLFALQRSERRGSVKMREISGG